MTVLKICGSCIISAIVCSILKSAKNEVSVYVLIGAIIAVFAALLPEIADMLGLFEKLGVNGKTAECIGIMTKSLGIAYIAGAASDICKESGSASLAAKVETAAKIEIIALTVPYICELVALAVRTAG